MGPLPEEVIEALQGSTNIGIFVYADFDPPLRLWLGVNDVPIGMESVDPDTGQVYKGGGQLQGVPELEVLINGIADRVEFSVSGVDPDYLAQRDPDEFDVRGAAIHVGITALDEYYQPVSQIIPLWDGRASYVRQIMPPVTGTQNPSVTVMLSVGGGVTTRARNAQVLWSAAHQRALYPTDAFCDGTARLARGVAPAWPRF